MLRVKHHRGQDNQQLLYDDLTGLPNRRLLVQQMIRALTSARERGHRAAILCLTIDRFQQADGHGQIVKDKCLKRVATMLTRRLRGMDTVARTGEEEFTIVLGEVESVGAVCIVAKALMELFAIPMEAEECPILLRASIGCAVYPDHGESETQLWQDADAAMRRAKRDGGGRYLLATQDTNTDVAENVELEDHMRRMLQEGGLRLALSAAISHEWSNSRSGGAGAIAASNPRICKSGSLYPTGRGERIDSPSRKICDRRSLPTINALEQGGNDTGSNCGQRIASAIDAQRFCRRGAASHPGVGSGPCTPGDRDHGESGLEF